MKQRWDVCVAGETSAKLAPVCQYRKQRGVKRAFHRGQGYEQAAVAGTAAAGSA